MDTKLKPWLIALGVEGVLILIFSALTYLDLPSDNKHNVIWSFPAGMSFIALVLLALKSNPFYTWLDINLQKAAGWFRISALQFLLFGTSLSFTFITINAAGFETQMYNFEVAVVAWLIGISITIFGSWDRAEDFPVFTRQTLFWFVTLSVFAFVWRGVSTGSVPILLSADEAAAGVNAVDFATGRSNNIFVSSWFSFPSLFPAIQSIGVRIWGNSVEALRIPSAVIGALTVGVVYLLGRSMFGQRAGLFAALGLAALHFHIHFSRLGLNNIWDGLWFTLTLGSLWYGWKTNLRWVHILAGLSLGFSQYFYASGKTLPFILPVILALAFYFQRQQFNQSLPNFAVTVMVALAVVLPLLWHYFQDPSTLVAPFVRVSLIEEAASFSSPLRNFLLHQLPASLGAYTFTKSVAYYLPGVPILSRFPKNMS